MLWRKMCKMKFILFLLFLIGFIGCKSSNTNSSETKEVSRSVVLEKVENSSSEIQELSKSLELAESEIIQSKNTVFVFGKWRIQSIVKFGEIVDLPYKEWDMQLTFEEENKTVGIKSPCNSGGCNCELNDSKISIGGNCFFTEMYCDDELKNKWEKKLIEVLEDQTEVTYSSEITLKLNGSTFNVELSRI